MGRVKGSSFVTATDLNLDDYLTSILQGGQNKKATFQSLINLIGANGVPLQVDEEISSAQVLDIHNTAVQIIPAPGSGRYIRVLSAEYYLIYNSVAYVAVSTPSIQMYYDTGRTHSVNMVTAGGFMAGTEDLVTTVEVSAGLTNKSISAIENKPVYVMTTGAGSWITGNSIFRARVSYLIIEI